MYTEEADETGEGGAIMVSAVVRAPPADVFRVGGRTLLGVRVLGLGLFRVGSVAGSGGKCREEGPVWVGGWVGGVRWREVQGARPGVGGWVRGGRWVRLRGKTILLLFCSIGGLGSLEELHVSATCQRNCSLKCISLAPLRTFPLP